jgi:hypothetical protein
VTPDDVCHRRREAVLERGGELNPKVLAKARRKHTQCLVGSEPRTVSLPTGPDVPFRLTTYNQGAAAGWRKQVIATRGSHAIRVLDCGGDGRLSLFGANWHRGSSTGGALELWINQGDAP